MSPDAGETWEQRMSARAQQRRAVEYAAQRAREEAEWEAENAEWLAAHQAQHDEIVAAGVPCAECFEPDPIEQQIFFSEHPGPWEWVHREPKYPRMFRDENGYPWTMCDHDCHPYPLMYVVAAPSVAIG